MTQVSEMSRPLLDEDNSNLSDDEDQEAGLIVGGTDNGCGRLGTVNGYLKDRRDDPLVTMIPNRHHSSRRMRRLTRWVFVTIGILIAFFLFYIPLFSNVHSRLVAIPGWGYSTSRNASDYVLPSLNTTLLEPQSICEKNFFLLIVVCSSVTNFAARQTIRETWGNTSEFNYPQFSAMHSNLAGQYLDVKELSLRMYADHLGLVNVTNLNMTTQHKNSSVRIVFLIGKENEDASLGNETYSRLLAEQYQYNDLIQEDFLDTYNNLTIKSIMMLKWVNMKCQTRAKFLMKCDDDTFINVPNLLHVLLGGTVPVYNATVPFYDQITVNALSPSNRMTMNQNLLTGYLFCQSKPIADTASKWYSPIYMYSGDTYPNYLSGSSYLMSFDVIPKLYNASLHTSLLHLEDVYLTGICAQRINLKRRHHPLFSFSYSNNKCVYRGTITQHYLKGYLMRNVYNFIMNTTNRCPPPDKSLKVNRLRKRLKTCQ